MKTMKIKRVTALTLLLLAGAGASVAVYESRNPERLSPSEYLRATLQSGAGPTNSVCARARDCETGVCRVTTQEVGERITAGSCSTTAAPYRLCKGIVGVCDEAGVRHGHFLRGKGQVDYVE